MPTISVIVPVYNVEKYIHRCVDSILAQTFTDFELILVDDGSPDNCGAICDEYAEKDSRVRVIHQENQGQAAARNHGVDRAVGKLVCFVDSDDAVHPQMLEQLYRVQHGATRSISLCGVMEAETTGSFLDKKMEKAFVERYSINEENLIKLTVKPYICWVVCAKLIPIDIIKKNPFENGRIYEDTAVAIKWLYDAEEILVLPQPLYYYQINPVGTTKSQWAEKKARDMMWAREQQLSFCLDNKMNRLFCVFFSKYLLELAYNYHIGKQSHSEVTMEIRKRAIWWWKRYSKCADLSAEQRQYVNGMLHPFWEKVGEWIDNHWK